MNINDANGCTATDSVKVCVIDVRCGNKLDKVRLCHNGLSICIKLSDVPFHLPHGDPLAACGTSKTCSFPTVRLSEGGVEYDGAFVEAYPNPFADNTVLRFMLTNDGPAVLNVYDAIGRLVAKPFDAQITGNEVYETTFDAENLSDGIYFYRLSTESGERHVGKLILTR